LIDESRDRYFVDNGVRVLRVAARDVRGDLESVLVRVRAALEGRPVE
jgi:very-short-patch-repair endonuclease